MFFFVVNTQILAGFLLWLQHTIAVQVVITNSLGTCAGMKARGQGADSQKYLFYRKYHILPKVKLACHNSDKVDSQRSFKNCRCKVYHKARHNFKARLEQP